MVKSCLTNGDYTIKEAAELPQHKYMFAHLGRLNGGKRRVKLSDELRMLSSLLRNFDKRMPNKWNVSFLLRVELQMPYLGQT